MHFRNIIRRLQYTVSLRDRNRQLTILGIILGVISLILYINLTVTLLRKNRSGNSKNITEDYPTEQVTTYPSTVTTNSSKKYRNYSLKASIQYENIGRPLAHSLYTNMDLICLHNAFIDSVNIRLFSSQNTSQSFHLFIVSCDWKYGCNITNRYAIMPQMNTDEWQTIILPSNELLILGGQNLAIGAEQSNTTLEIYGVKRILSFFATKIYENTTNIYSILSLSHGIAFGYTTIDKD